MRVLLLSATFALLPGGAPDLQAQSAHLTPGEPTPLAADSADVFGTVMDVNGGLVPGAQVTLLGSDETPTRSVEADGAGRFDLSNLPPGTYSLKVTAPQFQSFSTKSFTLRVGERFEATHITLPLARAAADVTVTVTEEELATEQVHEAERQRVFGVLPNFYSSYVWDAAPLNPAQKFGLARHSILDPVAFLAAGFVAGAQQANGSFKGYGQGAQGYAKRFGAAYADGAIGTLLGDAVLPSLLHQDPRYFYRGSGTTMARAQYAVSTAFIRRGDNGRWQPNYSHLIGGLATGAISNAYYPASDRGAMLTVDNWLLGIGGDMAAGLVREFLMRPLTHNVPSYKNGKSE